MPSTFQLQPFLLKFEPTGTRPFEIDVVDANIMIDNNCFDWEALDNNGDPRPRRVEEYAPLLRQAILTIYEVDLTTAQLEAFIKYARLSQKEFQVRFNDGSKSQLSSKTSQ